MANPYEKYLNPQGSGPTLVVPAQPSPERPEDAQAKRDKEARDDITFKERNQPKLPAGYVWEGGEVGRKAVPIPGVVVDANKPTEYQAKSAGFYGRMISAERQFNATPEDSRDPRTVVGQKFHEILPSLDNSFNGESRQISDSAALDFVRASLRQESGAVINPDEEIKQYRIFFPMPGDGPDQLAAKARARAQMIAGFRVAAGPLAGQIEGTITKPVEGKPADKPVENNQPPWAAKPTDPNDPNTPLAPPPFPGGVVRNVDKPDEANGYRFEDQDVAALSAYAHSPNATPEGFMRLHEKLSGGQVTVKLEDSARILKAIKAGSEYGGVDYSQSDEAYKQGLVDKANEGMTPGEQSSRDVGSSVDQGFLFNLKDELKGIGAAVVPGGQGYTEARDTERALNEKYAKENPKMALAGNVAGGLTSAVLLPGGALKSASMGQKIKTGAGIGAAYGGLSGFGSGEGVADSLTSGAIGAAAGGTIGAAIPPVGSALASVYRKVAPAKAAATIAQPIIDAGRAEGVSVNRAMVDPSQANRVARVDASYLGSSGLQSGMNKVSGELETGVNALGRGGTAMEPAVAGQTLLDSAGRYIKNSGQVASRQYTRAERLAGDIKLPAIESGKQVGQIITRLSETANTNSAEISWLKGLEDDLGKGLSVAALRDLRTTLRQKIAKGELTFGQNERRVLDIMDGIGTDISAGLEAAGKKDAAAAFSRADAAYRQRMQFINGELQKVIGKRNANLSPEQVFNNFKTMATPKGNAGGMGRILNEMEQDEAADIAATMASALGKNGKGEFSPAFLASQAQKIPSAAREALFGKDGAQSLENLALLAREHARVSGNMNRGSARARGDSFKAMITGLMGLGGYGAAGGTAGLATAATIGGTLAARDLLSARALMSTSLTKWALNTPKNPAAAQAHIARLTSIAAREPVISGEVKALQQYLYDQFAQSPQKLAAQPGDQQPQ